MRAGSEEILMKLRCISQNAGRYSESVRRCGLFASRRRGIGGSGLNYVNETRRDRSIVDNVVGPDLTDRINSSLRYYDYCREVLPFLKGKQALADGTPSPEKKFCMKAICAILGCCLTYLYRPRKDLRFRLASGEEEVLCIMDVSGMRERQQRRNGSREGFPSLGELQEYECGCHFSPCWEVLPVQNLCKLWEDFSKLAQPTNTCSAREREQQYLINHMFCPLTNDVVRTCDEAISELVAELRIIVYAICRDSTVLSRPLRQHGMKVYRKTHHPMNRLPAAVRRRYEQGLDMVLRADPAATGSITMRVYSPEVNTPEKLLHLVSEECGEQIGDSLHPSSFRRIL